MKRELKAMSEKIKLIQPLFGILKIDAGVNDENSCDCSC